MDLLFKRYASPFIFLDNMLLAGRFSEFIDEFIKIIEEEKEEKTLWDFYLHKVYDKTFNEFKESLANDVKNQTVTEAELEATIEDSRSILGGFKIKQEGV